MNYIEFEILRKLLENKDINLEMISEELYIPVEIIKKEYEFLVNNNYIDNNNNIQKKGTDCIENHKVDNAIILAAGMSTRFVPLSYEKPKGLLEVKGLPLIERQILQLREKGIEEIIIVVGYMKDCFKYLVDKYNVILVETDEYKERNNHASIYAAREYLKNSIITSSDLYFSKNIFQKYAYDSYYCTIYIDGKTDERGILTDDQNKIIDTFYGERCKNIWVTLGYAYFSSFFSKKMIDILEKEYNNPNTVDKFWADIQDEHLNELYMYSKRCDRNIIYEFDSLEELRLFDNDYLYNSNCRVMKEICRLINTSENKIINIKTLKDKKYSLFSFENDNIEYICNVDSNFDNEVVYNNKVYKYFKSNQDKDVNLYK